MAIRFTCPGCQTPYTVADEMAGKKVRCKKCATVLALSAPSEEDEEPVEAAVPRLSSRPTPEIPEDDEHDEDLQPRRRRGAGEYGRRSRRKRPDLEGIAFLQKAILICILVNVAVAVLPFVVPAPYVAVAAAGTIPVGIAGTVFVIILAGKVYDNSGVGVLLGILALIPLINVIVLLVVNGAATRVLREHGIKVGLLGASVPAELRSTGSLRGLTFGLIGGIGAIALLCGGAAFWLFRSLDFMDGTWPDPLADQGGRPGMNLANSVTLHISGVDDEYTIDAVFGKLRGLADPGRGGGVLAKGGNGRITAIVAPVADPKALADRIDFGTVQRIFARTIRIEAHKVEGPPKDADAVTKALFDMKSSNIARRMSALTRLKGLPPDQRRSEVAKSLEPLVASADFSMKRSAIEALAVWGTKESVPLLLDVLRGSKDMGNREVIQALARLKDERAIEPLAERLGNFFDRRDVEIALKTFGPAAEKAVAERLNHSDRGTRDAACNVLREIGTKQSIPALEALVTQTKNDPGLANKAKDTIKAIRARQ